MRTRPATLEDASAIAAIYNQGIEDRIATFETQARTATEISSWFEDGWPIVVVEEGGELIAFAAASGYRPRPCYAGIAEFSVYVARAARGRGAGRAAMGALIVAAEAAGFWKLVSRVFPENNASRALLQGLGFREVGIYERHAKLDGWWRDVVIVERLIPPNQNASADLASSTGANPDPPRRRLRSESGSSRAGLDANVGNREITGT